MSRAKLGSEHWAGYCPLCRGGLDARDDETVNFAYVPWHGECLVNFSRAFKTVMVEGARRGFKQTFSDEQVREIRTYSNVEETGAARPTGEGGAA